MSGWYPVTITVSTPCSASFSIGMFVERRFDTFVDTFVRQLGEFDSFQHQIQLTRQDCLSGSDSGYRKWALFFSERSMSLLVNVIDGLH